MEPRREFTAKHVFLPSDLEPDAVRAFCKQSLASYVGPPSPAAAFRVRLLVRSHARCACRDPSTFVAANSIIHRLVYVWYGFVTWAGKAELSHILLSLIHAMQLASGLSHNLSPAAWYIFVYVL